MYPPEIESKLPAQAGNQIKIQARLPSQSNGIAIYYIIKDVSSNVEVMSGQVGLVELINSTSSIYNIRITLPLEPKLFSGLFYKLQLYYKQNGLFLYSRPGIFKYTEEPTILLDESEEQYMDNFININLIVQCADMTERLSSYSIEIINYEKSSEVFYDDNQESIIISYTSKSLITDENCNIKFSMKTTNGFSTVKFFSLRLKKPAFPRNLKIITSSQFMEENGYVNYEIQDEGNNQETLYEVYRENLKTKENILVGSFHIPNNDIKKRICGIDNTITSGESYNYRVRRRSAGIWSALVKEQEASELKYINVFFEHIFLSDSQHTLKVAYNPQISSFKDVVSENKIITIGSPYPVFFRNGYIRYKEFPISGLLTKLLDYNTETPFLNQSDNNNLETNLTKNNINKEKDFKLEALDWLSNGRPKLFRSPTEGTYIVRLINVNLTPSVPLGRMLHSFSCTACEIDSWEKVSRSYQSSNSNNNTYGIIPNGGLKMIDNLFGIDEAQTFILDGGIGGE